MKKLATYVVGMCFCHIAFPQASGEVFQTAMSAPIKDSVRVVTEISLADQISENGPATFYKSTPSGLVPDEEPRAFRHQTRAQMTWVVYTRKAWQKNCQPHILLDMIGLPSASYISLKGGFGLSFREDHFSIGLLGGSFTRQVNRVTDFRYKSRYYDQGPIIGGYISAEPRYFSFFSSYTSEKSVEGRESYKRMIVSWKIGESVSFAPKGLRLHVESESFLGTGLGLSYKTNDNHATFSISYLAPNDADREDQKNLHRLIGNGLNVSVAVRWF